MTLHRLPYLVLPLYLYALIFCASAQDAPDHVDLGAFTKEVMKLKMSGNKTQLAMWFPLEFFVEATLAEGGGTRAAAEREVAFLKAYQAVLVQCGTIDALGRTTYAAEDSVRSRAVLALRDGSSIKPLKEVPPLVNATMAAMKAMISAEGDAGSANIHVLVFPARDRAGKSVVNTGKKDKLTLVLKASGQFERSTFTWHTPFDATTRVPPCGKCSENLSAKWSFCPFCGTRIRRQ